ncbi:hypothetical protein EI77_01083 [Prosthecobacter fusiformis]|uniref:Uncharacterized protein n=1 Tax=Prosthecobacter fusiformis TaxID=48464 RepID=A0A4V3FIC1_9BACT|nr:hypothetical protein [Prosthecobacter fusiformis]TDU81773.1 hypothetical protein EI77_01083 [Prosthecobacter fusiformis]
MIHSGFRPGLAALVASLALNAGAQITQRGDTVGKILNEWHEAGTAAGLEAITYENRDGQHSPLKTAQYPQLQIFQPDTKSGPPTGPAMALRMKPTVGNCSMSAAADQGGSLPRLYQVDPQGQKFLMMQYLANNLMIYPEHQDYDIGGNGVGGYGDLYPSNNACSIISQGSSGSDQPFLNAVFTTIAAFPPETQKMLIEKRLLMPTVQSIFRQSNKKVKTASDYLTGAAHPVVFDVSGLDEEKMVRMAHETTPAKIPPLVQVEVVEETSLVAGKDYFEAEKPHPYKLADTPVSIARIMRGNGSEYVVTVSAKKSADLTGRPVRLRWQLLQGNPKLVRLESSTKEPVARLTVRWHPPLTTASGIRSHRVDIGLFADNDVSVSAPAIISFYMLPNEMHFYDAQGRISEICYQAHNPELGLPPSSQDARWLKAMQAVSLAGDGLRSRLVEKLLTAPERQAIHKAWLPLDEQWQEVRRLEADPGKKDKAAALKKTLLQSVATTLDTPLPGDRALTVRTAIEQALEAVAGFTDLYPSFQRELLSLAAKSSKPTAQADIAHQIQRLKDLNIFSENSSGLITPFVPLDQLTDADRYYISGLNRTLLSQVLFPEALERSNAPAWVDRRLTTPKPWRDVHRYDKEGKLIGWIRHQAGRTAWFAPDGRYLPDGLGQPDKALPVIYEKNEQGLLEWRSK